MRFIIIAMALFSLLFQAASAQNQTFFRYKDEQVSYTQPETPEYPNPDLYDVDATFIAIVGEPASYQIPLKHGKFADSWLLASGHLPGGLSLDNETGTISGSPTGRGNTLARVMAFSVDGTEASTANVRFTVLESPGVSEQITAFAHSDRYFEVPIAAVNEAATWQAVTPLPSWASANGSLLKGTPPAGLEGVFSFALQGKNYAGYDTKFVYGEIVVTQGPIVNFISDSVFDPFNNLTVPAIATNTAGKVRWKLEGDSLPAGLYLDSERGRIEGAFRTFSTTATIRFVAIDSDGTSGYSNYFRISTRDPELSLNDVSDRTMYVGVPTAFRLGSSELTGVPTWTVATGSFPDGIALDSSNGVITGIPTTSGVYDGISIGVSTNTGYSATSSEFEITVLEQSISAQVTRSKVRIGTAFSTNLPSLENAYEPYTYSLASGQTLEPTLSLNTSTGVITGSVATAGTKSVMLQVEDSRGTVSNPFVVSIEAFNPLAISVAPETTVLIRTQTEAAIEPSLATNSFIEPDEGSAGEFNLIGALPAGLIFDTKNGKITGKSTLQGFFGPYQISVTDGSGATAISNSFNIQVDEKDEISVEILNFEFPAWRNTNVRLGQVSDSVGQAHWAVKSGTLPEGLTLQPDGYVTGVATTQGTYPNVVISVTDDENAIAESPPFSIVVTPPAPLEITNDFIEWPINRPIEARLLAQNYAENISFSIISGALPEGLSMASNGQFTGTAIAASESTIGVRAIDSLARAVEKTIVVAIKNPLSLTLNPTYEIPLGSMAQIVPNVENVIGAAGFSIEGSLPAGLEFNETSGVIVGLPTVEGQSRIVTVSATDRLGSQASASTRISVSPREPLRVAYDFSTPLKVNSNVGLPKRPLEPTNAVGSVTYRLTGTLPVGLTFNAEDGTFRGTPQQAGVFEGIYVYGREGVGVETISDEIRITITSEENFHIRSHAVVGREGSYFVSPEPDVTGASGVLTFTSVPANPLGLTLNSSTGSFAGVPTSVGSAVATVTAVDGLGRQVNYTATLKAVGSLQVSYPATTANQYSQIFIAPTVMNAIGDVSYKIVSGSLPNGLTLNPTTGVISGLSAAKVDVTVQIGVEDEGFTDNLATSNAFQISIGDRQPLEISTKEVQGIIANQTYRLTLGTNNAYGDVSWSMTGTLPNGLSMTPEGVIHGAATALGSYEVTFEAEDIIGGYASKTISFSVTTNGQPIRLTNFDIKTKVGREFASIAPLVGNSVGDYHFYSDNIVALGLDLDTATGVVSGRYDNTASVTGNIHVSDSTNRVTTMPITIEVIPNMTVSMREMINITVSAVMDIVRPTVEYSIGSVRYELIGPSLPTGLTFNKSNGSISGTPTQLGTFTGYYVEATDSFGDTQVSDEFSITIFSSGVLPKVSVSETIDLPTHPNNPRNITVTASTKKVGDVYSINKPLPGSMEIDQNTGQISGMLNLDDVGVYEGYVVTLTDTAGNEAQSNEFRIRVYSTPAQSYSISDLTTRRGVPFTSSPAVLTAGRAAGDVEFKSNSLPTYLTLDTVTGVVSGIVPQSVTNNSLNLGVYAQDEIGNYHVDSLLTLSRLNINYNRSDEVGVAGITLRSRTPAITNSVGPVTFRWQEGHDVPGVHLDPETGVISGDLPFGTYNSRAVIAEDDLESVNVLHSFTGTNPPGQFTPENINVSNSEPNIWVQSEAIKVGGIREATTGRVNASNYRYKVCDISDCSDASWSDLISSPSDILISPNQYIQFQILSNSINGKRTLTYTLNNTSMVFSVQTRGYSRMPDQVDFGAENIVMDFHSTSEAYVAQLVGFLDPMQLTFSKSGSSSITTRFKLCDSFEECKSGEGAWLAITTVNNVPPGKWIAIQASSTANHSQSSTLQVRSGYEVFGTLSFRIRAQSKDISAVDFGTQVATPGDIVYSDIYKLEGFLDSTQTSFVPSGTNKANSVLYKICETYEECEVDANWKPVVTSNFNVMPGYLRFKTDVKSTATGIISILYRYSGGGAWNTVGTYNIQIREP